MQDRRRSLEAVVSTRPMNHCVDSVLKHVQIMNNATSVVADVSLVLKLKFNPIMTCIEKHERLQKDVLAPSFALIYVPKPEVQV